MRDVAADGTLNQPPPPGRTPGRNDRCWCGSNRKYKFCHLWKDSHARRQKAAALPPKRPIVLKTPEQIEGIRRACQLTKRTLDGVETLVRVGTPTIEIDTWVHEFTLANGATPATLGYKGFPRSVCTSINEVVCHGIPGPRRFRDGDIVNIDVTSILDGYFGDMSRMYVLGNASQAARQIVRVTQECLDLAIAQVAPGKTLGDMGHAIQQHAVRHGYSVVPNIGGHGVGLEFHEEPWVPHFGKPGEGVELRAGMTFTIEPMINAGKPDSKTLRDKWTIVTTDGSLSAQWEHTVCVTETGVDVLTA